MNGGRVIKNNLTYPPKLFIFRYLYNMNTSIKKWRDINKDKLKLQKKREKIKQYLRRYNVLPKVGEEPNEEQKRI